MQLNLTHNLIMANPGLIGCKTGCWNLLNGMSGLARDGEFRGLTFNGRRLGLADCTLKHLPEPVQLLPYPRVTNDTITIVLVCRFWGQ
jgi:hypothetical protein